MVWLHRLRIENRLAGTDIERRYATHNDPGDGNNQHEVRTVGVSHRLAYIRVNKGDREAYQEQSKQNDALVLSDESEFHQTFVGAKAEDTSWDAAQEVIHQRAIVKHSTDRLKRHEHGADHHDAEPTTRFFLEVD